MVHHRFGDHTTLQFAVAVLCAAGSASVTTGALAGPGPAPPTALGLDCIPLSAMLMTCVWRRPSRTRRSRLAHGTR